MMVSARSTLRVTAEQWTDWDAPLPDICFEKRHGDTPRTRKPSRVQITTPHVHLTRDRSYDGPWEFIHVGDWILRNMDGAIVGVMRDAEFQRSFEIEGTTA